MSIFAAATSLSLCLFKAKPSRQGEFSSAQQDFTIIRIAHNVKAGDACKEPAPGFAAGVTCALGNLSL